MALLANHFSPISFLSNKFLLIHISHAFFLDAMLLKQGLKFWKMLIKLLWVECRFVFMFKEISKFYLKTCISVQEPIYPFCPNNPVVSN